MDDKRHIWRLWIDSLHRWGVAEAVSLALEVMKPLAVVLGQVIYAFQPFARGGGLYHNTGVLAELMTDPKEFDAFLEMLQHPEKV